MSQTSHEETPKMRMCIDGESLPETAVVSLELAERLEDRHIRMVVEAKLISVALSNFKWDYCSEITVFRGDDLLFTGACVKGDLQDDGYLYLKCESALRQMERTTIRNFGTFGMTGKEVMYHLALLSGARGAEIEGFVPDRELRPFLYSVPIVGLTAEGGIKSLLINDLGVAAGEADDAIFPLISQLDLPDKDPVWGEEIPKAFGVVLANDLIQAEKLSRRRAELTTQIINFSLKAGLSCLQDRLGCDLIGWDLDVSSSQVKLAPWILIREVKSIKGWARQLPWTESTIEPDLGDVYDRLSKFVDRLSKASVVGDVRDQKGIREIAPRERRLIESIQRCLHWYTAASSEENLTDRFLALRIALEAVLDGIDYPKVFAKSRASVKKFIGKSIREARYPTGSDPHLLIDARFLLARLNRNDWPLARKLQIFARSLGIQLRAEDSRLVRDLARIRGSTLHAGSESSLLDGQQLRRLEYLVERLVIAAAVCAYADIEDDRITTLTIGSTRNDEDPPPVFVNGREVDYLFHGYQVKPGELEIEYLIEGKVYDGRNSRLEHA